MKFISVRDAKTHLSATIDDSQDRRVVITRHGKPVAVMIGCEGYDLEDFFWASNSRFWKMIEDRREKPRGGRSLTEVRRRLARKDAKKGKLRKRKTG